MDRLDEISVKKLHDALDNIEGKKPAQRLLAAIAFKNGVTQTELAERHNTGRRTIYSWLKRLVSSEPGNLLRKPSYAIYSPTPRPSF